MVSALSPNFGPRAPGLQIDMLVLHYTGMASMADALARMCDPGAQVSAHYMIDEDGTVYRLVEEAQRAWHAGVSLWAGERDINSVSIGIELVNPGHPYPGYTGGYRPFAEAQMQSLEALARDIVVRHAIPGHRVLGHSDVAPGRKTDPGELFDWERLARAGIGIMPAQAGGEYGPALAPGMTGGAVRDFQRSLALFGYGIGDTGVFDEETVSVTTAFQRHYRRTLVDGVADGETRARLGSLVVQLQTM
ncbi:MAG: N-acetylmuramoyl-L-alanine amidase [Sphingomonadales bacterium]